jgi:hypothetical protein
MLRKLLLGSVAAFGLSAPFVAAGSADAHEFHRGYRHGHEVRVYFRDACAPGWSFAGRFHSRREAERVAESYRCRGFEVFIR